MKVSVAELHDRVAEVIVVVERALDAVGEIDLVCRRRRVTGVDNLKIGELRSLIFHQELIDGERRGL